MSAWDVVVAGAGPAGALAAREHARRGASVLLVERRPFPRWKVCGACLSPGALALLERAGLGSLVLDLGGVPLRRMTIFHASRHASLDLAGTVALSRAVLDQALVEAAVAEGATFVDGARVTVASSPVEPPYVECVLEGGAVTETVRARAVVDATGLGHGVERVTQSAVAAASRVGLGATLSASACDLEPGELWMVVGPRGYVGLVRLADGTVNVGAAVDPAALRNGAAGDVVSELLVGAGRPALGGAPIQGWRGTPQLTRRAGLPAAGRIVRVGDASGYVEPFTGEGIAWAMAAGLSVAGQDEPARSRRLCRALAWGLRRPPLVSAAVAALARMPALAAPLVRRAAAS